MANVQDNQPDATRRPERAPRSTQETEHLKVETGEVPTPTGMGDADGIGGASGAVAHGAAPAESR
jgi:hypothetical protein